MLQHVTKFTATVGYLGLIRFMPGTIGSLPAFLIAYLIFLQSSDSSLVYIILAFNKNPQLVLELFYKGTIISMALFLLGTFVTSKYLNKAGTKDPAEVVIDELAGQLLTITLSFFSIIIAFESGLFDKMGLYLFNFIFLFLLPFVLFRVFDILKPWPINWLDNNMPGAVGVMIDDIAAAIFAACVQYVIVFMLV